MAAVPVTPRVHAMVLGDEIEEREEEGTYDLLGVRTHIHADGLPYTHPQLCVYLQVTGHEGSAKLHFKLLQAATDEAVYETTEQDVPLYGPLEVVYVWRRLTDCGVPQAGVSYIQAYFGAKLANERLLILSGESGLPNGQANGQTNGPAGS